MEETTTTQTEQTTALKTTADALTFSEHKAIREGTRVPAEPATRETRAEETDDAHESDNAAETDAADQDNQGKPKPKRDRSLDGRISELTAARRRAEQERDELRSKIAEIEKGSRPSTQDKTEKPAAASQTADADDNPKPKLSEYLAKAKAEDTYEEVHERYLEARDAWRDRQTAKAEQERQHETRRREAAKSWEQKLSAARKEYEDFDDATKGDVQANSGLVLTRPMVEFVVEHDLGAHIGYWLGKHAEEFARIAQLSPRMQTAELGAIAREVAAARSGSTAADHNPDKPKTPPVSRVAPPPRSVSAAGAPEPKSPAEARTMAEYRRLRQQQGRG